MLASSTGHVWKFVLPLLANCRQHHCLVLPKSLFGTGKSSVTDKCFIRIKTLFHPLSVISTKNFRITSTIASSGCLSRQLSSSYMSSPVMFWKSFEHRHASTDSTKDGDKFRIAMAKSLLKELKYAPTPPLVLGISGLIPFVSFPALMFMSNVYMPDMAMAQATYGAVILSFLGGIRWGTCISYNSIIKPDWNNLGLAVLPSLVGWSALQLSCPASTMVLAGSFAYLAYHDMSYPPYLPWFKALQLLLTGIAVLALSSDLLCYLTLCKSSGKQTKKQESKY